MDKISLLRKKIFLKKKELYKLRAAKRALTPLQKSLRDYRQRLRKEEQKKRAFERRWAKTVAKIRYEMETAFSWQTVFSARFVCPERKEPTKRLEGYSGVRFTRKAKPSLSEQNEMRDEAIRWIRRNYLDGNSECEPVEETVILDLRRRDLKREGEAMRKARLDKKAAKEKQKKVRK